MQALLVAQDNPGIADNEVLDSFEIPFGTWIEQAVNWTTLNLGWLLDAIAWPFEFLLSNVVDNFLLKIPWLVLVAIMFLIAWLVRNLTVATATAIGLTVCGLLGDQYWEETARTIGLILVAVIVCVDHRHTGRDPVRSDRRGVAGGADRPWTPCRSSTPSCTSCPSSTSGASGGWRRRWPPWSSPCPR